MSFAASVSPEAAALIADIDLKEANDPRVVVTRKEAMLMLGVKQTKLLELEAAGILRSFLDGASRRGIDLRQIARAGSRQPPAQRRAGESASAEAHAAAAGFGRPSHAREATP